MSSPHITTMFGFWSAACVATVTNAAHNVAADWINRFRFMIGLIKRSSRNAPVSKLHTWDFRLSGETSYARALAGQVDTNRLLQFQKRGQQFIRTHNETLPVAAMWVGNEDRSPVWNPRRRHSPKSNRLC